MSKSASRHSNRLVEQTSPYLLQHAHNPVDWYPWGPEALERARRENRPILLSIGYSACHWCHVMERESFENEEIAALMNEHFVCIKVDREERPDLDDIYMEATVRLSGQGGWPMTVFLTPDQKPYFAGTYFPPEDGLGRPGFKTLLTHMSTIWRERPEEVTEQAERITARLRREAESQKVAGLELDIFDLAAHDLADRFDAEYGGFGGAPKFPAAASLQLLLRHHRRSGEEHSLRMVEVTLDRMAAGGIYDHIGGGFCRYATDERWLVPHFEKMLYDNALMTRAYLQAYQVTGNQEYARVARETLDYVRGEMTAPEGGYYSATDADSEGVEGKFFVWTVEEIEAILGSEGARAFCAYYDITRSGNWEGHSIPNTPAGLNEVARRLGRESEELAAELAESRRKVYQARRQRVAPGTDDKILTAWNAMMISAMARGAEVLQNQDYLESAQRAAEFLLGTLRDPQGRLLRTYRAGKAHLQGYLEDYAWVLEALLDLYEVSASSRYLDEASTLAERLVQHFADPAAGGFFATADDHEELIVRHRAGTDGATPAANSVACRALVRLSHLLERPQWRTLAEKAVLAYAADIRRMPSMFCTALEVLEWNWHTPTEVVLTRAPGWEPLVAELNRHFLPLRVLAWAPGQLPLLQGKTVGPAAELFLCRGGTCAAPVNTPQAVAGALEGLRAGSAPSQSWLSGRATPEGTAKAAARHPGGYRQLGRTNLQVSVLGFGGYRIDDETEEHEEALRQALEAGVNLIDTSTNYTDGASERLIGKVLAELAERRQELVVVSKLGYVQGHNLELAVRRKKAGRPFPEMVEYAPTCWHCLHPDYLADQLDRMQARLGLQTVDVVLLHNPEYFLSDARQRGSTDLEALRSEFSRRLEVAFGYLESQVREGRIGCYGVSSNTCVEPCDNPESTSLEAMLAAAQAAGGEGHHFRVLQLPLNLIESGAALTVNHGQKTVLEAAQEKEIAVLVNRPLNAFKVDRMARLAEFEPGDEADDLERDLQRLEELENGYHEQFGPYVQGPGAEQLFRWAANLRPLTEILQSLEHWTQLEAGRIRPGLQEMVGALDSAMVQSPLAENWVTWRDMYMQAFRDVTNDLEDLAIRRSHAVSSRISSMIEPHLPAERRDESLSRKSLWVVLSTPGVTSVLNGMRSEEYVDDSTGVLQWPRLEGALPVYKVLADW